MIDWQPIATAPKNQEILVYQPETAFMGHPGFYIELTMVVTIPTEDFVDFIVAGIGGYEWECELNWESITHWASINKPEDT